MSFVDYGYLSCALLGVCVCACSIIYIIYSLTLAHLLLVVEIVLVI